MNVRELREKKSLSQQDLSDKTGIPKSRIAKWEQGKGRPKADDLETLKQFFGENVPRETQPIELHEDAESYGINYRNKYIALLENENSAKAKLIEVSLNELITSNRIAQAHMKALLQITVAETAAMQGKDIADALMQANKVVADNFLEAGKMGK